MRERVGVESGRNEAESRHACGGKAPGPELLQDSLLLPSGPEVSLFSGHTDRALHLRRLRPAGMLLQLLLAGRLETRIAGLPQERVQNGRGPVRVQMTAFDTPCETYHRIRSDEELRLLTVFVGWDWLQARGLERGQVLRGRPNRVESWAVGNAGQERARRLFRDMNDGAVGPCGILGRELLALAMADQAIEVLLENPGGLRPQERERMSRMEAYATRPGPMPPVEDIAAEGNMSVSSLRRLVRRVHGCSVLDWVGDIRMQRAAMALKRGETVAEAARIAGYGSSAAFSTAFRKRTGSTPSHFSAECRG